MDKLDKILNKLNKIEKQIEKINNMLEPKAGVVEESLDPLIPDAIQYILEKNSVSSAELQSHFDIGYARTNRILDELCELGFIEEFDIETDTQIIIKEAASQRPVTEESRLVEAVKIIKKRKTVSSAVLQRNLKIGYAHAAQLLDELEELGYIAPAEGSKPRAVLERKKKKSVARN